MKSYNQTSENSQDSGVLSNPLSFIHSGNVGSSSAYLDYRGSIGMYWSLHSVNTEIANGLYLYGTRLNSQSNDFHGDGFAVRQILHHSH